MLQASLWMRFLIIWEEAETLEEIPQKMERKELPNQTY